MHIITTRSLIKTVAERWDKAYPDPYKVLYIYRMTGDRQAGDISKQLHALDTDTCDKKAVEYIIGNDSWLRLQCDECGTEVGFVVQVGESKDYESNTANLCAGCIIKLASLVASQGN